MTLLNLGLLDSLVSWYTSIADGVAPLNLLSRVPSHCHRRRRFSQPPLPCPTTPARSSFLSAFSPMSCYTEAITGVVPLGLLARVLVSSPLSFPPACCCISATVSVVPLNLRSHFLLH